MGEYVDYTFLKRFSKVIINFGSPFGEELRRQILKGFARKEDDFPYNLIQIAIMADGKSPMFHNIKFDFRIYLNNKMIFDSNGNRYTVDFLELDPNAISNYLKIVCWVENTKEPFDLLNHNIKPSMFDGYVYFTFDSIFSKNLVKIDDINDSENVDNFKVARINDIIFGCDLYSNIRDSIRACVNEIMDKILMYYPEFCWIKNDNLTIKAMMNAMYGKNYYGVNPVVPRNYIKNVSYDIFNPVNKEKEREDINMRPWRMLKISKVYFNKPYTIVIFEDRSKVIVKCEGEDYDPEKGLAMAIAKRVYGTNESRSNYYEVFKKFLPEKSFDWDKEE